MRSGLVVTQVGAEQTHVPRQTDETDLVTFQDRNDRCIVRAARLDFPVIDDLGGDAELGGAA